MASTYSTWRDYYLVIQGFFYGAQGIAYGIALFFMAYLRSFGIDKEVALTLQSVLLIPWYIKFLFGVISDNFTIGRFGRRKPYVFIAALLGLTGWISLPLYSQYSGLLLLSGFAASMGIALADASIDALAVDITPPDRRGSMQGVSWGFRGLGFGAATLFGGALIDAGQWKTAFLIPGVLSTVATLLVLFFKEEALPADFTRVPARVYKEVFSHRSVQWTLIFQIFSGSAIAIIFLLETFLSTQLNYTPLQVGQTLFYFALGMFSGSIVFGILGDRIEVKKTFVGLSLVYALIILVIFLVDMTQFWQTAVYFAGIGTINGGYEATQMRISMDYSPTILGGTMFNLYNSISNIGQIAIGTNLIFALILLMPTKIAWQFFSLFLLIAALIVRKLVNQYPSEQTTEIGSQLIHQ